MEKRLQWKTVEWYKGDFADVDTIIVSAEAVQAITSRQTISTIGRLRHLNWLKGQYIQGAFIAMPLLYNEE